MSQPAWTDSPGVLNRLSRAPAFCPCGSKLTCPSCAHGEHDVETPKRATPGSSQPGTLLGKRQRLGGRDQPPRDLRDAELEFPSGTTSASEEPVVPEDFDRLMTRISQLQEEVSSIKQRLPASRARTATDVPSRLSRSPTLATTTSTQQGKLISVFHHRPVQCAIRRGQVRVRCLSTIQ